MENGSLSPAIRNKGFFLFIILANVLSASLGWAQNKGAIELATLIIEEFMLPPGARPDWAMAANVPQIVWTTKGVEERSNGGATSSVREGKVRVLLNGKEMQHLRQRLEPITWELFMSSDSPSRFGPEQIGITPKCDTVQCAFDLKKALANKGLALRQLCQSGPASFHRTGFEVRKNTKVTHLVFTENVGSGGLSTLISLHFNTPKDSKTLCGDT